MTKEDKKDAALKKEIGRRFKEFREFIKKSQDQLVDELQVSQSLIYYIETGKSFPGYPLQYYLHRRYHLSLNWLITGIGGMIMSPEEELKYAELTQLFSHIDETDPRFKAYMELKRLMNIPVIEQIIFAKLEEVKIIAAEEIEAFLKES